jgi:hypothetical protein
MDSIEEILNEDSAEVVAEVAAEPVVEAQPRAPDGKFAPKGETESASPAPVEEPAFDHAAVKGERERRKAAEQRAKELEERLKALEQPPQPLPSVFEDENAWQEQFGTHVVSTAVQQATFNSKLDMSEMMVRQANPDFDEMKETFLSLVEQNPALRQQALEDPHPWNKAYQIAKNYKSMQDLGATDVESLRAKIRAEVEAELTATQPRRAPITLSTEQNVGTRAGPAWGGPRSIEELLG